MQTQQINNTNGVKRGRPYRNYEVHRVNLHLDKSLYEFILSHKGDLSVTEYINSVIRKETEK